MSTIKVDTITDEAGSGAPDFPNGMTGNGSSLTGLATAAQGALAATALQSSSPLAAANLTGTLPAIDGSALTGVGGGAPDLSGGITASTGVTINSTGSNIPVGAVLLANFGSSKAGTTLGSNASINRLAYGATMTCDGNSLSNNYLLFHTGYTSVSTTTVVQTGTYQVLSSSSYDSNAPCICQRIA